MTEKATLYALLDKKMGRYIKFGVTSDFDLFLYEINRSSTKDRYSPLATLIVDKESVDEKKIYQYLSDFFGKDDNSDQGYFKCSKTKSISLLKLIAEASNKSEDLTIFVNDEIPVVAGEAKEKEDFTDEYFATRIIGKMVVESFRYLSKNDLLSDKDILDFMSPSYCKHFYNHYYPILINDPKKIRNKNQDRKYYAEAFKFNDQIYYLQHDWYPKDRSLIVPFLKSKIHSNSQT